MRGIGAVSDEDVVARSGQQCVVAGAAHQRVVAGIALDRVVVGSAVGGVVAVFAVERVFAVSTEHRVVAGVSVEQVVPDSAVQGVIAAVASERVVAVPAGNRVVSGTAEHGVVVEAAVDHVVSGAAVDPVEAFAAVDCIVAVVGVDGIVAVTAVDRIVPVTGLDGVVTGPGVDDVVAVLADQQIVPVPAGDGIVSVVSVDGVGTELAAVKDVVAVSPVEMVVERRAENRIRSVAPLGHDGGHVESIGGVDCPQVDEVPAGGAKGCNRADVTNSDGPRFRVRTVHKNISVLHRKHDGVVGIGGDLQRAGLEGERRVDGQQRTILKGFDRRAPKFPTVTPRCSSWPPCGSRLLPESIQPRREMHLCHPSTVLVLCTLDAFIGQRKRLCPTYVLKLL